MVLKKGILQAYLFGEGGVWRDIVGTPVVGVLWLGNGVPCVKLRFNWGLLLFMPLIEKPSAPSENMTVYTKITARVTFFGCHKSQAKLDTCTYFADHTNLHQAATIDLTLMVREMPASAKRCKKYLFHFYSAPQGALVIWKALYINVKLTFALTSFSVRWGNIEGWP